MISVFLFSILWCSHFYPRRLLATWPFYCFISYALLACCLLFHPAVAPDRTTKHSVQCPFPFCPVSHLGSMGGVGLFVCSAFATENWAVSPNAPHEKLTDPRSSQLTRKDWGLGDWCHQGSAQFGRANKKKEKKPPSDPPLGGMAKTREQCVIDGHDHAASHHIHPIHLGNT